MMKVLILIYLLFPPTNPIKDIPDLPCNDFEVFFEKFVCALNKKDDVPIRFPLNVECFADRSKGKNLNENEFYNKFDLIFPQEIISKLQNRNHLDVEKKSFEYYVCSIGFSIWDENSGLDDEYGFHYHFKKNDNGGWELVNITCVG